jgi:hypothetical protein
LPSNKVNPERACDVKRSVFLGQRKNGGPARGVKLWRTTSSVLDGPTTHRQAELGGRAS